MLQKPWLKKFLLLGIAAMLIVVGITCFTATQAATTFVYTVTELASLGSPATVAYDINDSGQVVGSSYFSPGAGSGRQQSVLWNTNGTIKAYWESSLPYNIASSINNWGQVACNNSPGRLTSGRCPYVWKNGKRTNIGQCGSAEVTAINDLGQVTGWDVGSAFVWKDGFTTPLSNLDNNGNYTNSRALGINNKGKSVGYSATATITDNTITSTEHAVLWYGGSITDLGTLPGGNRSNALGINRHEQVVGWSDTSNGLKHAVLWEKGTVKDLKTLNGNNTKATDINVRSTVVGYSFTTTNSLEIPQHAFVWRNGFMRDINRLLPVNSGWEINTARAINNRGQIVGEGKFNGQPSAYLLTPTWITN